MSTKVEAGQFYLHYNKGVFEVRCLAMHCDSGKDHVIFHKPDNPEANWTRPLDEFLDQVEVNGVSIRRFTPIDAIKR